MPGENVENKERQGTVEEMKVDKPNPREKLSAEVVVEGGSEIERREISDESAYEMLKTPEVEAYREKLREADPRELRSKHFYLVEPGKDLVEDTKKEFEARRDSYLNGPDSLGRYKVCLTCVSADQEMEVGLGEILPPNIKEVTVYTVEGQVLTGVRTVIDGRVCYKNVKTNEYLPVFTGDLVEFGKVAKMPKQEYKNVIEQEIKVRRDYVKVERQIARSYSNGFERTNRVINGNAKEQLEFDLLQKVVPSRDVLRKYSPEALAKLEEIEREHMSFYTGPNTSSSRAKFEYMQRHRSLCRDLYSLIERDVPSEEVKNEVKKQVEYGNKVCNELGFSSALLFSIVKTESGFNPLSNHKTTASTASGLLQYLNSTWEGFVEDCNKKGVHHVEWGPKPLTLAHRYNTYVMLYATALRIKRTIDENNLQGASVEEISKMVYLTHHEGHGGGRYYKKWIDYLNSKGYKSKESILGFLSSNPNEFWAVANRFLKAGSQRRRLKKDPDKFLRVWFKHTKNVTNAAIALDSSGEVADDLLDDVVVSKERVRANKKFPKYFESSGNIAKSAAPGFDREKGKVPIREDARNQIEEMYKSGYRYFVNLSKPGEENRPIFEDLKSQGLDIYYISALDYSKWFMTKSSFLKFIPLFEDLGELINKNSKVVVNCTHGTHRAPATLTASALASGKFNSFDAAFNWAHADLDDYKNYKKTLYLDLLKYAKSKGARIEDKYLNYAGLNSIDEVPAIS
ncbi:hypothetical protein GF354_02700 [Candidatus Peregrinibacteria bacterium]|nr:hypothetical protein [Candidatus Peregrinibacteria bacterium]